MAWVKSDEVPMVLVNCGKTFHVERQLGSLPMSWGWRLSLEIEGGLRQTYFSVPKANQLRFCGSRNTGEGA